MPLSTEVFVMFIFLFGLPFFYSLLRDPQLAGGNWFLAAYACLLLSNIATVVEEFWLNRFFNFCEHLLITLSSILFVIAVTKLVRASEPRKDGIPSKPWERRR